MKATRTIAIRLICALSLLYAVGTADAQTPERPAAGQGRYLMVLWDSGTPGEDGVPVRNLEEPNLQSIGGTLLHSVDRTRLIDLPLEEVAALRQHPSIRYLQRVWMGEPPEEIEEEPLTAKASPRLAAEDGPETWGPRAYTYDGSGNIKSIGVDNYTYDTAGRLIQATVAGSTEKYKYDAFGNLIEMAVDGAAPVPIPVDGSSNRLTGKSYDAAGNLLADGRFDYDSLNMLSRSKGHFYLYDVNDELLGVVNSGGARWTFRDFEGRVLREYYTPNPNDWSVAWLWRQDFIYGEGELVAGETPQFFALGDPTRVYGGIRHYHLDHLKSVRMVTDADGRSMAQHEYYPFGASATKKNQEYALLKDFEIDEARFAGHWRDFQNNYDLEQRDYLDYMHARHYEPATGRFLSVDPVLDVKGNLPSPQGWNRYAYARNNPLLRVDPDGRKDKVFIVAALEAKYTMPMQRMLNAELRGTPYAGRVEVIGPSASRGQMLATLRNADSSDIVIIASHGGRSPDAARGGNIGTLFNGQSQITSGATMAQWANDGSAPKAVILAGCCTNQTAQTITNTAGSETLGTNHRTINGENQPGAVVATGVLARGGTIQDAATAANQHIKTDGGCGRNTGCDPNQPVRYEANPPQ